MTEALASRNDTGAPEPGTSSPVGRAIFLTAGMAVGAGAALALYRRPLESVLMAQRLKLLALGLRSREAIADGKRVTFWSGGDGSPTAIVLVHDPFTASETWHRVMPRIARSFRVMAPDLPGFGRSPEPVDATVDSMAGCLGALMRDEGIESAIVVGSSLGGLVAIATAIQFPTIVRGLVVADALGLGGAMPDPELLVHRSRSDVDELLRKLHDEPPPIPGFVRDEIVLRSQRPALRGLVADAPRAGLGLEPALAQIAAPTLILWGDGDGLAPIDHGERLNAAIPGSRLVRLSHCGHLPHREAPEAFFLELMDFLAGPGPDPVDPYDD